MSIELNNYNRPQLISKIAKMKEDSKIDKIKIMTYELKVEELNKIIQTQDEQIINFKQLLNIKDEFADDEFERHIEMEREK